MAELSQQRSAVVTATVLTVALMVLLRLAVHSSAGAGPVAQQGYGSVPTQAEVRGEGLPPNIECTWALPDMQSDVPIPIFQYGTPGNAHQHDDDMTIVPDANNTSTDGIQIPCAGPPGSTPSMPDGVRHMIQVRPNPEDRPEERKIQLFMAVDHPNGISKIVDVYWKVFHPDGSEKLQVHGTRAPKERCNPENSPALGNSSQTGRMFEAAVHTRQLSAAAVDDINKGMLAKCLQEEKAIYVAFWAISKHQPCGSIG